MGQDPRKEVQPMSVGGILHARYLAVAHLTGFRGPVKADHEFDLVGQAGVSTTVLRQWSLSTGFGQRFWQAMVACWLRELEHLVF